MIVPVILCGGVGSRMWPLSRQTYPKQFLRLYGNNSLLQETCLRVSDNQLFSAPILACNEEYRFRVADHLQQIGVSPMVILLEPCMRSTAPAAALAAMLAQKNAPDNLILVMPSDGLIKDGAAFTSAVRAGVELANQGYLVTFGIKPTKPATGYGYIQAGEKIGNGLHIESFIEKPNAPLAEKLCQQENVFWNSGMFLFRAGDYLEELEKFSPDIFHACMRALKKSNVDKDFLRPDISEFEACPKDSIDYAVMEHTSRAAVVPLECFWSDVGNWNALWEVLDNDSDGNSKLGDVILRDVANSYIRSENKLVVAIGLKDTIVVETQDAVLVCSKEHAELIGDVVEKLKNQDRREVYSQSKEYRPWGHYENFTADKNFLVKRIIVNPHSKLSLQVHEHRSEHWVVVKGTAVVTRGTERLVLKEGESTFISAKIEHRLENATSESLEIVEIQTGSYIGEDDITRLEDVYERK